MRAPMGTHTSPMSNWSHWRIPTLSLCAHFQRIGRGGARTISQLRSLLIPLFLLFFPFSSESLFSFHSIPHPHFSHSNLLPSSFLKPLFHLPHKPMSATVATARPHVLIVGAGLGGLLLGALLERCNIPYDIFERASSVKPLGNHSTRKHPTPITSNSTASIFFQNTSTHLSITFLFSCL